jgi:hypothetical protein
VTTACAGVALGVAATTGVAAAAPHAPAPAPVSTVLPTTAYASAALEPGFQPLSTSAADAEKTLVDARAALRDAERVEEEAAASALDLGVDPSIDTAALAESTRQLAEATFVPVLLFPELADDAGAEARRVESRVAQVEDALQAARAQKAAEEAAAEAQRQAEAAAAAEAQRQAELRAAANTPEGAKAVAQQMAAERFGWGGDQFSCLVSLWEKESNWNYQAYNDSSGATGIPQALPGSKMATAGGDWQTNAATQIAWGLDYIDRAYGTPCAAWGHSQATNWY